MGKEKFPENFQVNRGEICLAVSRRVVGNVYFCIIVVSFGNCNPRVMIICAARRVHCLSRLMLQRIPGELQKASNYSARNGSFASFLGHPV